MRRENGVADANLIRETVRAYRKLLRRSSGNSDCDLFPRLLSLAGRLEQNQAGPADAADVHRLARGYRDLLLVHGRILQLERLAIRLDKLSCGGRTAARD